MSDTAMLVKTTSAPTQEIIRVERVKKHYGDVEILKGVDLTVSAGKFTAIMGKSGSGKSTLLGIIAGLEKPDEGNVFIMGQKLDGMSDRDMATLRRRSIGIVFQGFSLIPSLTALDNVLLPTFFATETSAERRHQRGIALLKQVGLGERLYYHPATLSGGEQQRVAIARADEQSVDPAGGRADRQSRPGNRRLRARIAARSWPHAWHGALDGDTRSRRGGEGRQCRGDERRKDHRWPRVETSSRWAQPRQFWFWRRQPMKPMAQSRRSRLSP
jgi:predicted ABC-type transport system involved in lysophospholipase L1 biosynthesis ATPase subunit